MKTSTLLRIATELGLELVLVTTEALPSVRAVINDMRSKRPELGAQRLRSRCEIRPIVLKSVRM